MKRKSIGITVLLLLAIVSGLSVASAADVCRSLPSGDQAAGTTIPVSLTITLDEHDTYLIEDSVPSGWEITNAVGGSVSGDKSTVTYSALGSGTDTTVTYYVAVPGSAAAVSHCFNGLFGIGTGSMGPLDCGDMCVNVGGDPAPADVCRNLPSLDQTAGTTMQITLTITLDGADTYMIEDIVPNGWEITNAPGGSISGDKSTVSYSALGNGVDTTVTYCVAIPGSTTDGSYCFSGTFGIGSSPMGPLDCGDMCVNVDGDPAPADVCRNLPSNAQEDTTISVDLVITLDGANTYLIEDSVPSGWEITNAPDGSISGDKSTVTYSALGNGVDTTVTYDVAIPSGTSSGSYCFDGQFGIGAGSMGPLECGDTCVEIGPPCPCDFCFELEPGWNMVSIPKTIEGSNTATHVFKLGNGEVCLRYDPTVTPNLNPWEQFPNIIPCEGYMVYKQSDSTDYSVCVNFVNQGNSVPPEQQLYNGWNLIGHPDVTSTSVGNFASFTGLSDTMTQLWHRSNDGTWTGYPDWDLISVTPGQGYWAFLTADTKMAGTP